MKTTTKQQRRHGKTLKLTRRQTTRYIAKLHDLPHHIVTGKDTTSIAQYARQANRP